MVGVAEEEAEQGVGVEGLRTLKERFVLENEDHIQFCENSSCSCGGRGDAGVREEMQPWREAVYVCVRLCVYMYACLNRDFRSHLIALHAHETIQTSARGQRSVQSSTGKTLIL